MNKPVVYLSPETFAPYGKVLLPKLINIQKVTISIPNILDYWRQVIEFEGKCQIEVGLLHIYLRKRSFVEMERHSRTGEMLVNLDGDVFLPVAPAESDLKRLHQAVKIFRVPSRTAVYIPRGGWHAAPYPVKRGPVNLLVIFRSNTSQDDLEVIRLTEEISIKSKLKH